MATLTIPDDIYRRLVTRAASANITVEELVEPELMKIAQQVDPDAEATARERRRAALNDWLQAVQERAGRYPSDHVLDDSRESIYTGDEDRGH